MAHRSKRPDKRRRFIPSTSTQSPIEIALHRAAALLPSERAELLGPVREAFADFRRGHGNLEAWAQLSDTLNIASELALRQIASDHKDTFAAASEALAAVFTRCEQGGSWTLRGEEIAALDLAVDVFAIQLDYCSRGELGESVTRVINRVRQALAGNAAPGVRVCAPSLFLASSATQRSAALPQPQA